MALFDAGSSAYQSTAVTSAVTQVFSTSPGGTALAGPAGLVVLNQGPAPVYLGGSAVTAAASGGPVLAAGQEAYFSGPAANLWAITAAGSATVAAGLATVPAVI